MPSIALQISQAVEARLRVASVVLPSGTKTPPLGLTVEREKISVVHHAEVKNGPLISVSIGAEPQISRDHHKSPMTKRVLELLVGIYADANDMPGAEATDPAYLWMVHALQSEPTLGGLAHFISEEESEMAYTMSTESRDIVAGREVKVHIHFHTRTDDPGVRNN